MSLYLAQADLTSDSNFNRRVTSCVQQEISRWPAEDQPGMTPSQITAEIIVAVAATTGFADKYAYGYKEYGLLPGQSAINDQDILSAVQPLLEPFRGADAPAGGPLGVNPNRYGG